VVYKLAGVPRNSAVPMIHRLMARRITFGSIVIFVAALITRLVVIPQVPTEWDSVQLTFGTYHFDLYESSPHPPGYWLYIEMGRVVEWLTPLNATHSLSLVSALVSAAAIVLAWKLGNRLRGPLLGFTLAALIAALPFDWFYGAVPAVYSFDTLGALVFLNIALREKITTRQVAVAAAALGLLAGSRQSELSAFGPLMLYILWRSERRRKSLVAGVGVGLIALLAWIIPASIQQPGGVNALWHLSKAMWTNAANQTSIFSGAPKAAVHYNIGRATAAAVVSLLFAIPVFVVLWLTVTVRSSRGERSPVSPIRLVLVALLSALPGFLITVFGYYGKPGYALAYLPGAILIGVGALTVLRKSFYVCGCALLLVVAAVWSDQFLEQDALLPASWQNQHALWFTQGRYGPGYRDNTRHGIQRVDADAAQYRPLGAATDSRDTLVYEGQEGVWRFRQQTYLFPNRVAELTNIGSAYCQLAYNRDVGDCPQGVIEVQPGGRAVFVANAPTSDVQALAGTGEAQRITLATGPTSFAVSSGHTVDGMKIVTNPNLLGDIKSHEQQVTAPNS
jgi:hypothetical protein